jgi:hypothetical protein
VNWSPGLFFGLLGLPTVAFTSTVPADLRAGLTTVQLVVEVQSTDEDGNVPNLNVVPVVPRANPLPVTVTLVPPALGPVLGLSVVTVGCSNLK